MGTMFYLYMMSRASDTSTSGTKQPSSLHDNPQVHAFVLATTVSLIETPQTVMKTV